MSNSYEDKIILLKKREQQAVAPYEFDEPVSKVYYANDRQQRPNISLHAHLHIHQAHEQHYEVVPTYTDDFEYGVQMPYILILIIGVAAFLLVAMLVGLLVG